ncbi:MAG TPA: hypothetical protein VFL14_16685 [Xanthomonadales bacterium]|nr:hypothetical protein [Xanthomonadales bacterium]
MRMTMLTAAILLLAACGSSTKVAKTWKDPDTQKLACTKTLVYFPSQLATLRAIVEDRIVERMKTGVPARSVISTQVAKNRDALKARVEQLGFDCAVIVRFAGVDSKETYVTDYDAPYSSYGGFYAYYGTAWTIGWGPGYVTEEKTLTLDTNVYDIARDRMVWTGRSRSVKAEQAEDLVGDLVDEVAAAMRRDGLID